MISYRQSLLDHVLVVILMTLEKTCLILSVLQETKNHLLNLKTCLMQLLDYCAINVKKSLIKICVLDIFLAQIINI